MSHKIEFTMSEYRFDPQHLHVGVARKLFPEEDLPANLSCKVRVYYNDQVIGEEMVELNELWDGGLKSRYAGAVITAKTFQTLRHYLKQPVLLKFEIVEANHYLRNRTRAVVSFKPSV